MTKERLCVYAINRDVDKVRWDSVCSSARKSRLAELVRVPAYDGYSKEFSAPRALENLLGLREPRTLKGRPACFLSHVKAWSLIAADPAPYGVVIEDDVILSDQFDDFVTYARAGDVPDIGFLNIRMCNQRNLAYPNDPRKWISTGDILLKLSKDLKPGQFAPAQSTAHGVLTEP